MASHTRAAIRGTYRLRAWGARALASASVVAALSFATIALATFASGAARAHAQDEAADTEARSLFEAGRVAYEAGRYEDALSHFERAYELSHRAELLFNIGNTADRLRHTERALAAYRAYLEAAPDAPNRPMVERRIESLAALAADGAHDESAATEDTREPDAAAPDDPTSADEPRGGGADPAPWALFGTSAALLVLGGVLVGVGWADASAVADAPQGSSWADLADEAERAPILWGVGGALLGVGLAGVAASLAWALVAPGEGTAEVVLTPGGLSLRGRF